jgi:hypothetical protein
MRFYASTHSLSLGSTLLAAGYTPRHFRCALKAARLRLIRPPLLLENALHTNMRGFPSYYLRDAYKPSHVKHSFTLLRYPCLGCQFATRAVTIPHIFMVYE